MTVTHKNNFDFLRFVFACLVVISHSYPLSGHSETEQWIYSISKGQLNYADIGLSGFFVISGFFIYKSLIKSKSVYDYLKKRLLRLLPGFFIKSNTKSVSSVLVVFSALFYLLFVFYLPVLSGAQLFTLVGHEVLRLGTFFVIGSFLASIDFEKYITTKIFLFLFLLLFLILYFGYYHDFKHVIFSLFVLSLGFIKLPFLMKFGSYGDPSYGIYIYSFFIQQLLVYYFNINHALTLAIVSLLLSIVFGYASWHFVEKRFLRFKYNKG